MRWRDDPGDARSASTEAAPASAGAAEAATAEAQPEATAETRPEPEATAETQPGPEEREAAAVEQREKAVGRAAPAQVGELIAATDAERMRGQWRDVQASFVDDPRKAVQDADALVGAAMDDLRRRFENQRSALSGDWREAEHADTEALRMALRRYRQLFDSLVH